MFSFAITRAGGDIMSLERKALGFLLGAILRLSPKIGITRKGLCSRERIQNRKT